jgi:photosystem II stability/assembly factor-like uncharacterized protein
MFRTTIVLLFLLILLYSSGVVVRAQSSHTWSVQIASYRTEAEARDLVGTLRSQGLNAFWTRGTHQTRGIYYRVQAGKFSSMGEAAAKAAEWKLRRLIASYVLANENGPLPPQAVAPGNLAKSQNTATWKSPAEKSAAPKRQVSAVAAWSALRESVSSVAVVNKPEVPVVFAKGHKAVSDRVAAGKSAEPVKAMSKAKGSAATLHLTAEKGNVFYETEPEAGAIRFAAGAGARATASMTEITISNPAWQVARYGSGSESHLRAIHFANAENGWIAGDGGTVLRTVDGGRSWQKVTAQPGVNISYLYFADVRHGWMLGRAARKKDPFAAISDVADSDDSSQPIVLLRTVDGGESWKQQPLNQVSRLQFLNSREGWAVGSSATLMKTMDGGATWKRFDELSRVFMLAAENSGYSFGFSDVHFINPQQGWLIGNFTGKSQPQIGGVYTTHDGGLTWHRVPLPIEQNSDGIGSSKLIPGRLLSIRFADSKNGWISGEMNADGSKKYFALRTSDGGGTWLLADAPGKNQWFPDKAVGWTTSLNALSENQNSEFDAEIMRTDNGGARWLSDVTVRGSRIRHIFFLSPNQGWAVGDNGMILRYEDR